MPFAPGHLPSNDLFARLGAGDDIFQLDNPEAVKGDVTLDAGAGNDMASISGFIMDHIMARLGEGDDILTLGTTWAYRLIADGGLGLDRLSTTGNVYATYFDKYSWEYINGVRQDRWGYVYPTVKKPLATIGF